MSPGFRNLSYKLYLSLQGLIVLIGGSFFIWLLVTSVHDIYTTNAAKDCADKALGAWVIQDNSNGGKLSWTSAIEKYAESHPSKRYQVEKKLNDECSEKIHVFHTNYSFNIWIRTNWFNSSPATFGQRLSFMLITLALTFGFIGLFYGLMRWIRWLTKDMIQNNAEKI